MGKTLKISNGDSPAVKPQTKKVVANSIVYPKRIVIDEVKGFTATGDVTFVDLLNLCLNAIVSNGFKVIETTVFEESKAKPGEEATMTKQELEDYLVAVRKNVTAYLYDKMNEAFSDALGILAPDIQQHPGITEIAIMKCEDELIRDYLASLPEEQREVAQKEAEKLLEQSKRALLQKIKDQKQATPAETFVPLTPEQDAALKILADEDATDEAKEQAKAYIAANPLPCMTPARDPEAPTVIPVAEPSQEELDVCGEQHAKCQPVISEDGKAIEIVAKPSATCEGICAMCSNDPCLKAPTIDKMLEGLE